MIRAFHLEGRGLRDAGAEGAEGAVWLDLVESFQRKVRTIAGHAGFLRHQTALLLDATPGMIEIGRANIVTVFSVVAVIFLPPTLIASIYGMNFAHMPEIARRRGYPVAVVASVAAALVIFRRKGRFRWR